MKDGGIGKKSTPIWSKKIISMVRHDVLFMGIDFIVGKCKDALGGLVAEDDLGLG